MSTDDDACWDAFGSDSESDGEQPLSSTGNQEHDLEAIADLVSLAATQHFAHLIKTSGVPLNDRFVAIGSHNVPEWGALIASKLSDRGISVSTIKESVSKSLFDAAIIFHNTDKIDEKSSRLACHIRKSLLPGGSLWIISPLDCNPVGELTGDVWDIGSAVTTHPSHVYNVTKIQKHACLINAWSCPWMDKHSIIPEQIVHSKIGESIQPNETYLQYEQRVANNLTICPSVAERRREKLSIDIQSVHATVLTNAHVKEALSILRKSGLVIIKGLLPPEQTLVWGKAVLADFQDAANRLKSHPIRPVDLLNPHQTNGEESKRVFEPQNYKEMSMREDLRVDIRAGPTMKKVRQFNQQHDGSFSLPNNNEPFTVDSEIIGTVSNWRFHPSIIAILKALFNPKDDELSKGNFGRWNFGGSGPDGSPQPFRIGPIGSVISCPGAGDQAIHADTPHLFEHIDCLPCHYCNVFTPGFITSVDEENDGYFKHEFDNDGVWTGNTTMGGTALVNGSHKLSVTATFLAEDNGMSSSESLTRKQLLQLETIRPALDVGDVLIFDNRTLHYGLANNSSGDKTGVNVNAGRRPMLYLNVTQAWFHDPKNWDDRESIFEE